MVKVPIGVNTSGFLPFSKLMVFIFVFL
uniref:Uncharacterized protein n=1 Tax=Rhizophora mucronata TaxID=61149 RepID=A0A2P2P395_RHIMU